LKRVHCRSQDVLVDDQEKCPHLREQAGGLFIHHRDAQGSIKELRKHAFI
jgi:hypothetical protein